MGTSMQSAVFQDTDLKIHEDKVICKAGGCPLKLSEIINVLQEMVPVTWGSWIWEPDADHVIDKSFVVQEIR